MMMENNNEDTPKRGRGRPKIETKLDPMWYNIIVQSGREGKHITDFLIQLNISWESHYAMLKRNPKYYQAVAEHNKLNEQYWFEMAKNAMDRNGGVGFNSRLWSLVMRNKHPQNWQDQKQLDISTLGEKLTDNKSIKIEIIKGDQSDI
jgi:hypothetical protein